MLFKENLFSIIKTQLRVHNIYGTCPFYVSPSQKLAPKSHSNVTREYVRTILQTLYVMVIWSQLIHEGRNVPLVISLESLLCAIAVAVCLFSKWELLNRRKVFIELFNLFIQFERKHSTGNTNIYFLKINLF